MWQSYNIEYDVVVKNKLVPIHKWIFWQFIGQNQSSVVRPGCFMPRLIPLGRKPAQAMKNVEILNGRDLYGQDFASSYNRLNGG